MILWDKHPEHLELVNRVLGVAFRPEAVMWRAIMSTSMTVMAVVVYSDWTPWCCEVTVLVFDRKAITRNFIHSCAEYAFRYVGRVHVIVKDNDKRTQHLAERLGFKKEARLAGWFGSQDGIIFRMLRDECKWLRTRHEKPVAAACT